MDTDRLRDYYARRAAEYERIYEKPERQADLARLRALVPGLFAGRDVLEIACGTGYWTALIASSARSVLATDIGPEVIEIARRKSYPPRRVRFALADALDSGSDVASAGLAGGGLSPFCESGMDPKPAREANHPADASSGRLAAAEGGSPSAPVGDRGRGRIPGDGIGRRFTAAFAGFWWSHIPKGRIGPFLDRLHARLAPGARVVFLDNCFVAQSSTPIARTDGEGNSYQRRRLDDGSEHEVLKNFPAAGELRACVAGTARDVEVIELTYYWCLSYLVRTA